MNVEQESQAAITIVAKAKKLALRHSPSGSAPIHTAAILWQAFVIAMKEQGLDEWRGTPLE